MRPWSQNTLAAVIGGILVVGVAGTALAQARKGAAPAPRAEQVRPWTAAGGDVGIRWNYDLAGDLGIRFTPASVHGDRASDGSERFALRPDSALRFRVENGYARELLDGALQAQGGYRMALRDGQIDLDGFRLVPRRVKPGAEPQFDLVDANGVAWFHVDRVMHELLDAPGALTVGSSDILISERLAKRIGAPYAAGLPIGEVQLDAMVQAQGSGGLQPLSNQITWHGDPAPNGNTYQNDLFMLTTTLSYSRCRSCTGQNGNGEVVFTPSSTLKNNVNEGNTAATVPGDPLGTSTALYTATIPWYQKFSGNNPPYNNDQHPYLIWNMYRTNADGSLEQIGRSGVKQAYLTTNGSCLDSGDHHGHALGRGCTDTYSSGNNDYTQGLSPRHEILPATGQWARCGSTFDPDCNGVMNNVDGDEFNERMIVRESQIAPANNAGASWMYESWYLAREDINIYNSMSTRPVTPSWTGAIWNVSHGAERLGSAIDRWFGPVTPPPRNPKLAREHKHIDELVADGARAKVAVKVKRIAGGKWQYHYAVMNFEFAFAETSGSEPNLRVESSQGFDGFSINTRSAAVATAPVFRDGDLAAGNDWDFEADAEGLHWTDADAGHSLGWGELYSFSFVTSRRPVPGTAVLRADNAPDAATFEVETLVPAR